MGGLTPAGRYSGKAPHGRASIVLAMLVVFLLTHAVAGEEERRRDIDVTIGLEAFSDSNINMSEIAAQDDTRLTVYAEAAVERTTYAGDKIELGGKVRNNSYLDLDMYDGAELQAFARAVKNTSNGELGAEGHFSSVSDPLSEDLLLTDRVRRRVADAIVNWDAKWYKTQLAIDGRFDRIDYDDPLLAHGDNSVIELGTSVKKDVSPRTSLSLAYSHRAVDYDEDIRIDYSTDSLGAGVCYGEGRKLAFEADLRYTRVTPDAGDAEGTVTGSLRTTWDVREEKSRLMFLLAKDLLPATVGVYSSNSKVSLVWEHRYNRDVTSELGLGYEKGEYVNGGDIDVTRFAVYGGVSVTLGRNTVAYAKINHTSRDATGGAGLEYDSTSVSVGITYGF
ncbi:MAG: hypothetical protein JW909_07245 [Planctomycetes bacterium]|nr:hypothetical protein [Planctomycetota bacterium]